MIQFIKSMSWFVKKNWYRYILVIFFGLILSFLTLLPTQIIGNLTDAIEQGEVTEHYLIYDILIPFLIISFLIYAVSLLKRTCMNWLTTTLYYALHNRYIDSILIQDQSFFERIAAGDLLTRALGDINTVKFSGGNRLLNIFLEFCTICITFVALILIDPLLAVLCFIPLIFIAITNVALKMKVTKNWKIVREKHSEMGNVVLESITNVRTIRAYSKEEENYQKNLSYSEAAFQAEKENLKIQVIFQPLFQFIVMVSTLICYAMGAYFYHIGRITEISSIVKFAMYLGLFQSPLIRIGNMINNFYQSLISAERLNEVYDSRSTIEEGKEEIKSFENLEYKNTVFAYPLDDFDTLHGVSLKLSKGETLGIVGKTGSGKSTLVRLLLRQLKTRPGDLMFNEKPVEDYSKEEIRKLISYVPQEHILFSRSVYENVRMGRLDASKEEILEAVRLADFEKDIRDLAEGMDTMVGEYGVTLSGGQKQRLSIARAFLKNSDIMILDDSLSAVDGKTEANIIRSLEEYRKDKTNIIIAHRLSAVMHADHIIVMDKGKITEEGTHDELMKLKGWYYHQFESQRMGGDTHE